MNSSDVLLGLEPALRVFVALVPVQLFLIGLMTLDTFRLVRPRRVFIALAAGVASALVSFVANNTILELSGWPLLPFALVVAPMVEEAAKGVHTDWLVRTHRAGFLVDGTLLGFAVGAGFATAENIYYLRVMPDAPWLVWGIRGLGTAVMHGGAAALFAMLRVTAEHTGRSPLRSRLGAWGAAVAFHGIFNRFMTTPIPATVVLLVTLPALLVVVGRLGERSLRAWLGEGFDRDRRLLALITSGEVRSTPLGRHLEGLRTTVRPEVLADMLCLLRLEAELSIRAKGMLLLRENGFEVQPDPDVGDKLAEWRWLKQSMGRAGLLALRPVRPWQGVEAWQRRLLEEEIRS